MPTGRQVAFALRSSLLRSTSRYVARVVNPTLRSSFRSTKQLAAKYESLRSTSCKLSIPQGHKSMPCAGREPLSVVSEGCYPKSPPSVPVRRGTYRYCCVPGGTIWYVGVRGGTVGCVLVHVSVSMRAGGFSLSDPKKWDGLRRIMLTDLLRCLSS